MAGFKKERDDAIHYKTEAEAQRDEAIRYKDEADAQKIEAVQQKKNMYDIAKKYEETTGALSTALKVEFTNDLLSTWSAELIEATGTIRFNDIDVLFDVGKAEVKPKFKDILKEFFPKYVKVLSQEKFSQYIEEIRIEGHTSSEWYQTVSPEQAYFLNMELSQARAREVLKVCLSIDPNREWTQKLITANGLSSSILKMDDSDQDGTPETENKEKSRRVEFRVRTNAEQQIAEILKKGEEQK